MAYLDGANPFRRTQWHFLDDSSDAMAMSSNIPTVDSPVVEIRLEGPIYVGIPSIIPCSSSLSDLAKVTASPDQSLMNSFTPQETAELSWTSYSHSVDTLISQGNTHFTLKGYTLFKMNYNFYIKLIKTFNIYF